MCILHLTPILCKSLRMSKKLFLHLPKETKLSVDNGDYNFFSLLINAFQGIGIETTTKIQRRTSGRFACVGANYHIFYIDGAVGPHALNVRKAHFYPFWSLENAGNRRAPRVTQLEFEPSDINGIIAQEFFNKICVRNLPAHPPRIDENDFVFVPLQGHILEKRSWQFATTDQMIRSIVQHDPDRKILVKPHPKERYSRAEKSYISSLSDLENVTITDADTNSLLSQCAYVVTQNSAVAFEGFLYQKAAILFAQSDFAHICETVKDPALAADAFAKISLHRPAFEKFIFWYLQLNCINAGRDDAEHVILRMVRDCGWDI